MNRRSIEQPGLRLRMGAESRRIASQHRQLDAIYGRVLAALERGALPEARDALQRFRDAWEAHTSLEDGFYFPALRGLRPAIGERLAALSEEHGGFREALERLAALLAAGDAAEIAPALEGFVASINAHEAKEERILAELTAASR